MLNMDKVLLLLKIHAFPAPKIHNLPNGDLLTNHQGKPVMLKPYIIGQIVDDFYEHQLNQLGSALPNCMRFPFRRVCQINMVIW